jgi:hypothetical protein
VLARFETADKFLQHEFSAIQKKYIPLHPSPFTLFLLNCQAAK